MSADMNVVLVEKDGPLAIVTLNRPQAMNALSRSLRAELARAFEALDADESVHVVILTGAGDRAFTAGLDLKELGSDAGALADANAVEASANPVKAVEQCRKPVIGAINGVAITGGFELALACDILIASDRARFADTHARIGIMPGWGLSQKLSRLIGIYRAKEVSLSGNFIDARTALAWGLVNRVVAPEALLDTAKKLAADIANAPAQGVQMYKRIIDEGFAQSFAEGMALEHRMSSQANAAMTPDAIAKNREGVMMRGRLQSDSAS